MDSSIIETQAFREVLIQVLLDAPTVWSNRFWHESSGLAQTAIQRLIAAGLMEVRLDVQYEVEGGLLRKSQRVTRYFACSGHNSIRMIDDAIGVKVQASFGSQVFDVRLTGQGEIARTDLQSGDQEGFDNVCWFLFRGYVADPYCREVDLSNVPHQTVQNQAIAAAQANASVGDITINNQIDLSQFLPVSNPESGTIRADNQEKVAKKFPQNPDVIELCRLIRENTDPDVSIPDLARQLTDGDRKKANNIARQANRPEFRWLHSD